MRIATTRGDREFADGDRMMFLRNERSLEVKNGTLATIENVNERHMTVRLDDGRSVAFDAKNYADIDHGYAATIHKAQGMTVDRTHVLATPGMDQHSSYVALSRHQTGVELHYGRDDFADRGKLVRALGRERSKDMASDYSRDPARPDKAFAERRGIGLGERIVEAVRKVPEKARGMFDGLRLGVPSQPKSRGMFEGLKLNARPTAELERTPLDRAVERFARAAQPIVAARRQGSQELPHQSAAFEKTGQALDAIRPGAAGDMREAFSRDNTLIDAAAKGRTAQSIRAMALEAEVRANPSMRADRFIEDWSRLTDQKRAFRDADNDRGLTQVRKDMRGLAKSLERDPQIESLVRQRLPEIGIKVAKGASLSHDLQETLSRSRDIGLSL